jgi:hypothetical protein
VDVIDLQTHRFTSLPLPTLLSEQSQLLGLGQVFSAVEHGFLRPLMGDAILGQPQDLIITFDRFAQSSPYPPFLRWCLQTLEKAYGCPVDIEFASDGERFYLLQCRPQTARPDRTPVPLPTAIPEQQRIFSANRDIITASVHGIEYIVLIDPRDYNTLTTDDQRIAVAQVVRRLNQKLEGHRFILMGPGRWGTRDLRLGVRVGYSDINNTRLLVEIARKQGAYVPEVSFGSHFFQDLIESDISYLALYPDETGNLFREGFLHGSQNQLSSLLPEAKNLAGIIKVICVPAVAPGMRLNVDMDGDRQEALAYLAPSAGPAG